MSKYDTVDSAESLQKLIENVRKAQRNLLHFHKRKLTRYF